MAQAAQHITINSQMVNEAASSISKEVGNLSQQQSSLNGAANEMRNCISCRGADSLFSAMEKIAKNVGTFSNDLNSIANNLNSAASSATAVENANLNSM